MDFIAENLHWLYLCLMSPLVIYAIIFEIQCSRLINGLWSFRQEFTKALCDLSKNEDL